MPLVDVVVSCPVQKTFRVAQMAGIFDLPLERKATQSFSAEVPSLDEDWQIGCIVGPSGSGKTTIARKAFGELAGASDWPEEKSLLDGFPEALSVKEITAVLTSVGFSSPPSWIKPYAVLSNGEKFRCDLARALLENADRPVTAYDEFTSVVDRTVAKIGSAAVAKAIRRGILKREEASHSKASCASLPLHGSACSRFVAITCHYDVLEWLQPDWVLDMASGQFARGRLQRPEIRLAIAPVHHSAWSLFARHHYLSGAIRPGAKCFAAFWGETPVAFSAWMQAMTRKRRHGDMREHRTVVLPDFQGIGIGNRLSEFCASLWRALGGRAYSTTSHPGMIHYRSASPLWRRRRLGMASTPSARSGLFLMLQRCGKRKRYPGNSCARITGGFEYVGPAFSEGADRARALIEARPAVFQKRPSVQRVEAALRMSPGSTVGRIARVTGLTTSCARTCLEELIEAGDVRSAGRGGQADPLAFYPY